ncbi:MAG: cysteine methyltransferase [Frankiales bacterium]|nr:cysteine methyltransferase [Frankiales bacterium]
MSTEFDADSSADLASPVGRLRVSVGAGGLTGLRWLRAAEPPSPVEPRSSEPLSTVLAELAAYFAGELTRFDVPLDWGRLTGDRLLVLQSLAADVPYGQTVTYGQLAELSGTSIGARGVGSVMGSNPFPLVVPCHRVLAHDGLGGYSGGDPAAGHTGALETKRWLLMLEEGLARTITWPAP